MSDLFGLGSAIAFGAGGKAGGITGTALLGAGGIVEAATSGKGAKGQQAKGPGKKQQALMMMQQLLQSLAGTLAQGQGAGAQGGGTEAQLRELSRLGRENPDALRQALAANPQAAQGLGAALSG